MLSINLSIKKVERQFYFIIFLNFPLTNIKSYSKILIVRRDNTNMREWLSWWSTTLPRSGSRVRVPSRALKKGHPMDVLFCVCAPWARSNGWESRIRLGNKEVYSWTARVFIVRWNLKEAVSKPLARRTEITYKAGLCLVSPHKRIKP